MVDDGCSIITIYISVLVSHCPHYLSTESDSFESLIITVVKIQQQQQQLNDLDRFDSLSAFTVQLLSLADGTNENETTLQNLVSSGVVFVRWRAQRLREHFLLRCDQMCASRIIFLNRTG